MKNIQSKKSDYQLGTNHSLKLPKRIKYFDEVLDEEFKLENLEKNDVWEVSANGSKIKLNFKEFHKDDRFFMKLFIANTLLEYTPVTAIGRFKSVSEFLDYYANKNNSIAFKDIKNIHKYYINFTRMDCKTNNKFYGLKNYLVMLCEYNIGTLNLSDIAYIDSWYVPQFTKHRSAKSGDKRLSFYEENCIADYLSQRVKFYSVNTKFNPKELLIDSILSLAYCLGPRPKQLSLLRISDISTTYYNEHFYCDVKLKIIKQRTNKNEYSRKALATNWQEIVIKFWQFRKSNYDEGLWSTTPLLSLSEKARIPSEFTFIIRPVTKKILGESKTIYHFRHTFAQRMADSGCSALEIASALTHNNIETAQAYVGSSSNMAGLLSKATGKSSVYKDIPDLFKGRLVVQEVFNQAESEKKIDGVVDGVIMPGIGLCNVKVSMCDKSPLLSCHTCPKFMPLLDKKPHEDLANQLREMIFRFADLAIEDEKPSPPLIKMNATLAYIEKLLLEIEELG